MANHLRRGGGEMSGNITQAERLMRIETMLETMLPEIAARLKKIEDHQTKQDADAAADKADLAALKNKGAGLLIGVGLAGGAVGAGMAEFLGGLLK